MIYIVHGLIMAFLTETSVGNIPCNEFLRSGMAIRESCHLYLLFFRHLRYQLFHATYATLCIPKDTKLVKRQSIIRDRCIHPSERSLIDGDHLPCRMVFTLVDLYALAIVRPVLISSVIALPVPIASESRRLETLPTPEPIQQIRLSSRHVSGHIYPLAFPSTHLLCCDI